MYALFDIGGTKIRCALSGDTLDVDNLTIEIVPTPKKFDEGIAFFREYLNKHRRGRTIRAVAGGITGLLDEKRSLLIRSPHLPAWIDMPLKKELESVFESPVYIENDASMVGLGEAVYGAGKEHEIVAYITISTGVGGSRIVRGAIDTSKYGFEPGHQIIDPHGIPCSGCGQKGHLEGYVSGSALEQRFSKKAYEITDPAIWDEIARFLAYGLHNTTLHWSPDIIILGGSMMKEQGIPIERVKMHLTDIFAVFPQIPKIEKALLGDIGGLWGSLAFLAQKLENKNI